jgi:predicted methyltransferase
MGDSSVMFSIRICVQVFLALLGICTTLELCAVPAAASPAAANPVAAVPVTAVPAAVAAAITDPARPPEEVARDRDRRTAEVLTFAGVGPGERLADFMSGGAYFARLFSRIVGDRGRVYAFLPEEQLANCAPAETAGTRALVGDAHYTNVTLLRAAVAHFSSPEPLDLIWTSLNFHDLYDSFMGPANVAQVVASMFSALKPGGVLVIIDHVAEPGSGVRDTETLHRIDPETIIRTVRAAGFVLEAQSDLLRNAADHHDRAVFDPAIRGRTDQAVLKFTKPQESAAR